MWEGFLEEVWLEHDLDPGDTSWLVSTFLSLKQGNDTSLSG